MVFEASERRKKHRSVTFESFEIAGIIMDGFRNVLVFKSFKSITTKIGMVKISNLSYLNCFLRYPNSSLKLLILYILLIIN